MVVHHDVMKEETSGRVASYLEAQQPLKTLNIMRCEKETYPLYEKKVVGNVQPKEEPKNEENRKFLRGVVTSLMYVLEPILPDDGVKGDGKIAS